MPIDANPFPAADPFLLRLYKSCTEPRRWPEVMDLLCAELGAHSAIVQGLVLEGPHATTFWTAHDSRTNLAPYQASISDSGNPRLDRKRLHSCVGRLVRDEDLFDGDEWPKQQRLQQQLSALGYGRFLGGLISVGQGNYMALALHREVGDNGDFSDREKDRIAALLPHFAQALQLTQSVACSRSAEALLRGLLERWNCGLIVCDAEGQVLWRNEQALMSLTCGGGLRLRNGMLYATTAESQQRLELALRRQVGRNAPGYVVLDAGGCRWQLAVQELQPATVGGAEPLLLIALTGEQPTGVISAESLVTLFELTDAESRLTSALVAGSTLEEYAVRRGVELSTVRYQLKQVLAKTGTRRQVDLVRRVLCSAAAYVVGSREQIATARVR